MEEYLSRIILTKPDSSLELVPNGECPFDRKLSWMFWSGGAGRAGAQPAAMGRAGQAQGQHPTTDAYVALRQGLRGTGEEKVAAKKPTGKGVPLYDVSDHTNHIFSVRI